MLLLVLLGVLLVSFRRWLFGWLVVLIAVGLTWTSCSETVGRLLQASVLKPPPSLTAEQITALRSPDNEPTVIAVLGAGVERLAPEYGAPNLSAESMERLRYGIWLARETGLPLAFSGGVGWAQSNGAAEAAVASRIATQEYGQPLKWIEDRSRDTYENAENTVGLLQPIGVRRIVLVTHAWHMPRAVRRFEASAQGRLAVLPAPMGASGRASLVALGWMPSAYGFALVRNVLHEWMARVIDA